jgi:hypothetical protein
VKDKWGGETYESGKEELSGLGTPHNDLSLGPTQLGEEQVFCLCLITFWLYGNDDSLFINTNSRIMQIFQFIQALAMNERSQEEPAARDVGGRHDKVR